MGKVTVGYRYFLGMHLGICAGPVDAVMEIRAGDRMAWSGSVTSNASISIDSPEIFGGDEKEGGIQGTLDVMMGGATQAPNSYLVSQHGANTPAYRGILSAVWRRGLVASNNPYLKPWAFKIRRILQGWQGGSAWYSAKAAITLPGGVGQAMNPAHIVYECITNGDWGMGYGSSLIDDANFRAAADTFYAEGFGLCIQWTRQQSIEAFIQQVMDHCGGVLTQDRETGLFKLIPLRADYDVGDLLAFDESNILELESYQRPALPDAVNEITVQYADLATAADASITVQNLANITSQGGVVTQGKSYPGIPTGALAMRVALRDLRSQSTPLAKVRFKANRSAANLLPGEVIKLSWSKLGIDTLVLRVLRVNAGTIVDGAVSIEAAEDVFGLPSSSYAAQPPTGWTDPSTNPAAAANRVVREATYYELLQRLGGTITTAIPDEAGYVMAAASRPSGDSLDFGVNTRTGSAAFEESGRGPFAPGGALATGINQTATSATLVSTVDLDLVSVGTFGQIDNEIIRLDALDIVTGAITIGRGVLDTVAATHSSGSRVYFLEDFAAEDVTQRVEGEVVDVRLTPRTGRGELAVASAPTNTITVAGRPARPYPPGRVRVNSVAYPASDVSAFALSWAHRDRLLQNREGDESGNIGPEPGTTYSVELINNVTSATIDSASGISGTGYTPSSLPGGSTPIRVKLWAERGGLQSFQRHDFIVTYTAPVPGMLRTVVTSLIPGLATDGNATAIGVTLPATASILKGSAMGNVDTFIADVLLLLHCDGTNGSTTFTDSGPLAQTMTAVGSAQLTTSHKQFGTAGIELSGSAAATLGDGTTIPAGGWDFASAGGDFTIEGWVYIPSSETQSFVPIFAIEGPPASGSWSGITVAINNQNPTLSLALYNGNTQVSIPQGGAGVFPARDQWVHFAVVRESLHVRLFLNGQSLVNRVSGSNTYDWQDVGLSIPTNAKIKVGASNLGFAGAGAVWHDEIRVTKQARYSGSYAPVSTGGSAYVYDANFAPPGAAFPSYVPSNTYDPSYSNVVMLLHGRGTNGSTTIADSSLPNRTPTISGDVQISTSTSQVNGSSIRFDGSGDLLTYASSTDFYLGSTFTIEFWAKFDTLPGSGNNLRLLMFGTNGSNAGLAVTINSSGIMFVAVPDGSAPIATSASGAVATGVWAHWAVVCSSFVAKIYKNGTFTGTSDGGPTQASTSVGLRIGYDTPGTVNFQFQGNIEDVRITKGVARYTSNFVAPTAPLPDAPASRLLLHFNGSNGSTSLIDSSGDSRAVTANGTAALSTSQKKFGTASLALDGSSGCNATLSTPALSGDFTAEAWVYVTDTGVSRDVITLPGITLYRQSANVLAIFRSSGGGTNGSTTFTANAWHHVAMSRSGSTIRFFLDGNLEGSVTDSTSFSAGTAYIGSYSDGSERWVGYIDDLRLITGTAMYTASFVPPSAELSG